MSTENKKYINPKSQLPLKERNELLKQFKELGDKFYVSWSSVPGKLKEDGKREIVVDYKVINVYSVIEDPKDETKTKRNTLFTIKGFNKTLKENDKLTTVELSVDEKKKIELFKIKNLIVRSLENVIDALNVNTGDSTLYNNLKPVIFYRQIVDIEYEVNREGRNLGYQTFTNADYKTNQVALVEFRDPNKNIDTVRLYVMDPKNKTLDMPNVYILTIPKDHKLYPVFYEGTKLSQQEQQEFVKSQEFINTLITFEKKPKFEHDNVNDVNRSKENPFYVKQFFYSLSRGVGMNKVLVEAMQNAFGSLMSNVEQKPQSEEEESTEGSTSKKPFDFKSNAKKFSLK